VDRGFRQSDVFSEMTERALSQPESKPLPAESLSFEEALASLEQIVHDLEEGKLGLAESLSRYEQGVNLLKQCHQLLERAERRIELLTGVDAAGNPVTEVFDHQATMAAGAEESPPRARKSDKKRGQDARTPSDETSAPEKSGQLDERTRLF
jgi:exodeoxyribonuclease VII small subunit